MNVLRILFGLLAMIAVMQTVGVLQARLGIGVHYVAMGALGAFLGSALGAFVAQRRFLAPALCFAAAAYGAVLYVLYQIALPMGRASLAGLLSNNWFGLCAFFACVFAGVHAGEALARRRQPDNSSTPTPFRGAA